MNLKKLSNKTLVRFISELRGLMDFYAERGQHVEYATAETLYNEAKAEFRTRTESLGNFERLKYS